MTLHHPPIHPDHPHLGQAGQYMHLRLRGVRPWHKRKFNGVRRRECYPLKHPKEPMDTYNTITMGDFLKIKVAS